MKPQMAGETNWELWRRMSDSKKPGDKSLYIIHADVLCVFCIVAQVNNLRAFYMAKNETPGSVYRKKLVAPANCNSRRLMYGEQTEDQNKAESF
jgi:hypothetical protein